MIISSSSACVIALTWGGVRYSWTSVHVLAPLTVGLVGIAFFFFYEAIYAKEPLVYSAIILYKADADYDADSVHANIEPNQPIRVGSTGIDLVPF